MTPAVVDPDRSPTRDPSPAPPFHVLDAAHVASVLDVDPEQGLSSEEAARRLVATGPNRLDEAPGTPAWKRFLDQFRNGIVLLLVGAGVLAAALGDLKDPIVIGVVLLLNAILGFVQEGKAARAMDVLEGMLLTMVRARRDAMTVELPSHEVVPGDIVLLEAGDRVPADGRLLLDAQLSVDESSLTGESVPVDKQVDPVVGDDLPLGDRTNMLYMGTTLVRGRAEMLVTATGMGTEMGRIAGLLAEGETAPTPLQQQLDRLGKRLAVVALGAMVLVFGLRLAEGDDLADAALAAVTLAVAAVPEGLPAVVTVTLALGVSRMAKRNAIVKRLHSVETLGSTSVICSDKTGTLTRNQMTAVAVHVGGREVALDTVDDPTVLRLALLPGALCSDAVRRDDEAVGDPTELALLDAATSVGLDPVAERAARPRTGERPFDSADKYMATRHGDPDGDALMVKGAPDVLLARSTRTRTTDGLVEALDDDGRRALVAANEAMAERGWRVLALASRRLDADHVVDPDEDLAVEVHDLTLEALVAIVDPPRPEARDAIALCHRAGIDVKMITGDHAGTAGAIARDLGIEGRVVTGKSLDEMDDETLAREVDTIGVCARVSPEHKVRIVRALQANGRITAMTGDGVNDAAALHTADIGVAMGITGTEVTKEAGDLILADDHFATIVGAVEQGRTIYDNIVTFVRFQLSTNLGAITTMLGAGIAGLPLPLTPIQVLFVNLIADGPPAMTLGVDPPAPDTMQRPPRDPDVPILGSNRLARLGVLAAVMAAGTLGVLAWGSDRYGDLVGQTMAFTTFVLFQLVNSLNARAEHRSVFSRHSLTNGKLWAALGLVAAIQVMVVTWGPAQSLFETTGLSAGQWAVCASIALTVTVADEARKRVERLVRSRADGRSS